MSEPATCQELGEMLTALLAAIDSGELATSAATRHRIEGAVVALKALSAMTTEDLLRQLGVDVEPS